MAIQYQCKHCQTTIGRLEGTHPQASTLGLDHLTTDERQEMIHYESNGDVTIVAICEDCQEALERNPEWHEFGVFIQ